MPWMRLFGRSAMTMEGVGRVPVVDWLMGLTVLACGIAAIVAVWRYADQLGGGFAGAEDEPDEGGGHGEREVPLALPPGPANGISPLDAIDEELWSIIEAEHTRRPAVVSDPRADRIAARVQHGPTRGQSGQATFSLIIVVAVVAAAVVLLQRTAWHAERINDKAGVIATSGGGINTATQAVLKLGRTNELASSILDSAKPLEAKLDEIVRLARSVDGLATSINASAGTINGTARGINGTAGTILATARSINDGVAQINANLDTTLILADAIKTDTGDILAGARAADRSLDCIENGSLTGGNSVPGPIPC
jgi:methyl-accepting chemotaxis protein